MFFFVVGTRYYDPRTSVWQSPDPILNEYISGQTNGGVYNPKNLSLFSYTYNNPVKLVDPDGNTVEEYSTNWSKPLGGFNKNQTDQGINWHFKFRVSAYGADPKAYEVSKLTGKAEKFKLRRQSARMPFYKNGKLFGRVAFEIQGSVKAIKNKRYSTKANVVFINDNYDWGYDDDNFFGKTAIFIGSIIYNDQPLHRKKINKSTGVPTMRIHYNRKAKIKVNGKIE